MKKNIKKSLKKLINGLVNLLGKSSLGRYIYVQIITEAMNRTRKIQHNNIDLIFCIPNAVNIYRADTFSKKEPETLDWIDNMPRNSVVWDIGANVGLYSCYAAKARECLVYAFEPSVFNLELLARNIYLNSLTKLITIIPLPLSDVLSNNTFNMVNIDWGGAMSTFGKSYGHDGKVMDKVFEYSTIGISMVDALNHLKIKKPDYIKMDVDGIEHLILKGGMPILKDVKGILIEINDQFITQASEASMYLEQAGFVLKEKRQADFLSSGQSEFTFNQIWMK